MVLSSIRNWVIKMNSFETDLKRAFCSVNFIIGLLIECAILWRAGFKSEMFRISLPVLASLPYSTAWLSEYQSGYIKEYLPRCGQNSYIFGKFFACGISGGALPVLACFLYSQMGEGEELPEKFLLLFLSGMFWAVTAAVLAAAANSRYVAYGGAFVLFYMLVILYERYFTTLYCLYPVEWYAPEHTWVLGDTGIVLMLFGFIWIMGIFYDLIVARCIEHV